MSEEELYCTLMRDWVAGGDGCTFGSDGVPMRGAVPVDASLSTHPGDGWEGGWRPGGEGACGGAPRHA